MNQTRSHLPKCKLPADHKGPCARAIPPHTPGWPPMTPVCPCLAQSGYLCPECQQVPEEPTPALELENYCGVCGGHFRKGYAGTCSCLPAPGLDFEKAAKATEGFHAGADGAAYEDALNAQAAALVKAERERIVKMLAARRKAVPVNATSSYFGALDVPLYNLYSWAIREIEAVEREGDR